MRKGITLIESLFVLGIMAIIIGMVVIMLSQSSSREKNIALQEEVMEIYKVVQNNFSMTISSSADNFAPTIAKMGVLDNRYIQKNTIITPYGVPIIVEINNWDTQGISIWLNSLDKNSCMFIATNIWGSSQADIVNIRVNNSLISGITSFSPKDAASNCNMNANQIILNLSF